MEVPQGTQELCISREEIGVGARNPQTSTSAAWNHGFPIKVDRHSFVSDAFLAQALVPQGEPPLSPAASFMPALVVKDEEKTTLEEMSCISSWTPPLQFGCLHHQQSGWLGCGDCIWWPSHEDDRLDQLTNFSADLGFNSSISMQLPDTMDVDVLDFELALDPGYTYGSSFLEGSVWSITGSPPFNLDTQFHVQKEDFSVHGARSNLSQGDEMHAGSLMKSDCFTFADQIHDLTNKSTFSNWNQGINPEKSIDFVKVDGPVLGHEFTSCAFESMDCIQKPSTPLVLFPETNGPFPWHNKPNISSAQLRSHILTVAQRVSEIEELSSTATMELLEIPSEIAEVENPNAGVELVQNLLACAEAVACRDTQQATSVLQRVQPMASPHGNSLQRVAACFAEGLTARLGLLGSSASSAPPVQEALLDTQKLDGLQLMHEFCPYIRFGHFVANSAILDAFQNEKIVHVVDLGIGLGLQWPSLLESLSSRPSGPPSLLRITSIGTSMVKMNKVGRELEKLAGSFNLQFEFRVVVHSLENLDRSLLELREGEALAVNSVLQLHCVVKESRGSLNAVLQSIRALSPKVLTLVEQDASHNGPFFLGRFMEALHYYSAIFDSLDAAMPRYSTRRVKIEQFYFAEEIKNIVSCEGPARVERHERVDQWRRRMSRAGFQQYPQKLLSDAKAWLSRNYPCDGYTVAEEKGCLILGWRGKPIIAASSWR